MEPEFAGRATAMPVFAPLYTVGTESVDVRWMTASYATDPKVLRAVLPPTLDVDGSPTVAVWIAEFIDAEFRGDDGTVEKRPAYLQGGVSLRCRRDGRPAAYALETFVSGPNYGILGREVFGLPKKQASLIRLDESGDVVDFSIVNAAGAPLVEGTARLSSPDMVGSPAPEWFHRHYTVKAIPSAEGTGFDICRMVRIPWAFDGTRNIRNGVADIVVAPSTEDPLHIFGERATAEVAYGVSRLDIEFGTYLEHLDGLTAFGRPDWSRPRPGTGGSDHGE